MLINRIKILQGCAAGNWVLSEQERTLKAEQRADDAEQLIDRERQRADVLAARLREMGIDVDETL